MPSTRLFFGVSGKSNGLFAGEQEAVARLVFALGLGSLEVVQAVHGFEVDELGFGVPAFDVAAEMVAGIDQGLGDWNVAAHFVTGFDL